MVDHVFFNNLFRCGNNSGGGGGGSCGVGCGSDGGEVVWIIRRVIIIFFR